MHKIEEYTLVGWAYSNDETVTIGKSYMIRVSQKLGDHIVGMFDDDRNNLRVANLGSWVKTPSHLNIKPPTKSPMPKEPVLTKPTTAPEAKRYNTGKSPLSYMLEADIAMKGMCDVMAFGAEKYDRGNWKLGLKELEVMDSLLRHMMSYVSGEVLDPESGLPHVDHITCNAVFLATFGARKSDE